MSEPVIKIQGLSKRFVLGQTPTPASRIRNSLRSLFGKRPQEAQPALARQEFWALKDINLTVNKGDVIGIVGRNGAGKSTLLKILAQITAPTRGRIEIKGRIGSILEIGTGFSPDLTGRQNITLSAAILGMHEHEIRKKMDEIIDFAGVGRFIDVPVKFYSSGMYARLAFSVVAHLEHETLLIDEVLAVGDAEFQKKCVGKLHGEASSGRTVLFVSHSMASVSSLCNRAILLADGQITHDGSTDDIVDAYLEKVSSLDSMVDFENPESAPGNETFRLKKVVIRGEDNSERYRLKNSEDIHIDIDYWNVRDRAKIGATVAILNSAGVCVFGSLSNHEPNWHGKPRPLGAYRSTVTIPKHLMREGRYTLVVLLWSDSYTDQRRFDNVAEFEVTDSGVLRGDYFGGWEGYILPKLDWTCSKLD